MSGIYDVVILDVMLPKMNGFDVVRALSLIHIYMRKDSTGFLTDL